MAIIIIVHITKSDDDDNNGPNCREKSTYGYVKKKKINKVIITKYNSDGLSKREESISLYRFDDG